MTRPRATAGLTEGDVKAGRASPRLTIVLSPEAKAMAIELAAARGQSVGALVETLLRAEARREQRRAG